MHPALGHLNGLLEESTCRPFDLRFFFSVFSTRTGPDAGSRIGESSTDDNDDSLVREGGGGEGDVVVEDGTLINKAGNESEVPSS